MVGSQFHPEFRSRPDRPQPLFRELVRAARERAQGAATTEATVEAEEPVAASGLGWEKRAAPGEVSKALSEVPLAGFGVPRTSISSPNYTKS